MKSKWCEAEWTAKLAEQIPLNERRIVPIRIEPIEVKGLLKTIVYIDIVDKLEEDAKKEILDKLSDRREKKVYGYPSYYNIQHIEIDNDYYVNDDHIIFIKTCKSKVLRKGMKKIHNRITWFVDEGIELYALSEGTSIEKLDMHDTNINYNVVFDRELNVNEEVEYCVKAILTNNHKHFKNFFSSEIITPIDNLNIHLHIDNENVKKVFTQKVSDSPMNVRTEESKEHSFLHTFHWHIEKPELHFEYMVYW